MKVESSLVTVTGSPIRRLLLLCLTLIVAAAYLAPPAMATEKFVYLSDGIYIADQDGQNPAQVTTETSHLNPALSPDLQTIAFDKWDDSYETTDLYLVDSDGQNLRLLYDDTEGQSKNAAFSPDTGQVVFERWGSDYIPDLYRIDLDGQNLTQLTSDPMPEFDPAPSADGNLIAFAAFNASGSQIATMWPDGTNRQDVTPGSDIYFDWQPAFSPDGQEIVFTRADYELDTQEIWKVGVDGSNPTQLTYLSEPGENTLWYPTWSADGETIVFAIDGGEYADQLWAMNADGSNPHMVVDLGFMPNFRQANAMEIGGELFEDLEVDFELTPDGDYEATVSASDSVNGIARYELAIDSHDDQGYVLKDSVDIDCSEGCPPVGPTETLILDSTEVQNDESDLRVQAIDGAGNPASAKRKVRKGFYIGITEPRLGRVLKSDSDPEDPNLYPIYDPVVYDPDPADFRFTTLQPRYFRLMVPWERLEPSNDDFQWNADVGGGSAPGNKRWYKATIDDQISRIRELNPDVKIVAVFYRTPCWALIAQATPPPNDPCHQENGRFTQSNPASWPDLYRKVPYPGIEDCYRDPPPDPPCKTVLKEYRQFVNKFINRYSGPRVGENERIRFYSAWNEPNYFDQAQPQKCGQEHKDPITYPDFGQIPCPRGYNPNDLIVSDYYYYRLYKNLYDRVKRKTYDKKIKVLGGETAGIGRRSSTAKDSDEAKFSKYVIKKIKRTNRCGKHDGTKRLGAWSKHSYGDLQHNTYKTVTRLRRTLDGLKPNGNPAPNFDTEGCTKNKQIWITEVAGRYDKPKPEFAHCKLHDFIDGINIAPVEGGGQPDLRRTDVYMQYLYQTDWDPGPPARGFDSGLLVREPDEYGGSPMLDARPTYDVFSDWAAFAQGGERPTRDKYTGEPYNCASYWEE